MKLKPSSFKAIFKNTCFRSVFVSFLLDLTLCEVGDGPSVTWFWPSIDQRFPSIVGILSKRVLYVFDLNMSRYFTIIRLHTYVFSLEFQ